MPDFNAIVNLGVGGLALWMVYLLVKPLISAQMDALKQMTAAVQHIVAAQREMGETLRSMNERIERHMRNDEETDGKILRYMEAAARGA